MLEFKFTKTIPKIYKPKIPFTKVPNPLGTALIEYEDGIVEYVPLFYIQEGVMFIKDKVKGVYLKLVFLIRKKHLKLKTLERK